MSKDDLLDQVKYCLDPDNFAGFDCIESIEIMDDMETVNMRFKIVKVEEDDYIGLVGY